MYRRIIIGLLLVLAIPMAAITHTYSSQSVLQSGKWVKIRVSETGVHQITYEQLAAAGLTPANVRIYGYGGGKLAQDFNVRKIDDLPAVPFWIEKGSDNVFGEGDYILFYAQANISWSYNGVRFTHTRNPYSEYGYYFLTDNAGEQRLLTSSAAAIDNTNATEVTTYLDYQVHEKDLVNLLDVVKGCDGGGQEFYGELFTSINPSASFSFPFQNVVTSTPMRCYVDLAAYSGAITTFTITHGSSQQVVNIKEVPVTDYYTMGETNKFNGTLNPSGSSTQTISIQFKNSQTSARGYLNYIELTATCNLRMRGNALPFRTDENYDEETALEYVISNATSSTQVWNVTELDHIYRVPTTYSNAQVRCCVSNKDDIQQLVAVNVQNTTGWLQPEFIGGISNQNLHQYSDIDLVVITPIEFKEQAQRVADIHRDHDQMTTLVVTDQQVYNEFSSGTPDATAYRWLMKMLYDRGVNGKHKPRHLLLYGDGTFDNRQILAASPSVDSPGGKAWLLTYQTKNSLKETDAFPMDDYFAFMENNEGENETTGTMEFGVGRLPVGSVEEATSMADKIIEYIENTNYGKWKNQLLFIADDGDNGLHTQTAEAGSEKVRVKNPDFIVNKVYLDAYPQEKGASGESYPIAKNKIDNLFSSGILYMNYSGHGGYNGITNEGIMNLSSIKKMVNKNLGLWMLATCSFSHYDSGKRCAAEEAVLNPHGAAIAVMSACRTVYANQNTIINRNFCDTLFGHKDVYHYDMTIGQSTRIAKNKTGNDPNKRAYTLLGDPAIRLNYPTQFQVRTTVCPDTVHAVSTHQLNGEVIDSTGTRMDWFNGKVQIWIYDKLQKVTTRDNDEPTESKKTRITYNDYPNLLFSGEVDVKDGIFQTMFMAPLDIHYNYGNGRIVYYAYDIDNAAEAVGHYEKFVIGGSSTVAIMDTLGPNVHIYLNNKLFKDGDETHENPHFFADIDDEHGINAIGSGIGHDLMMVIDDDPLQTYVLNEYYQVMNGDYRQGAISYKMPQQTEGQHQLRFRAWDLLNNSTTKYLNYTVVNGKDTEIYSVTAYPNPAKANDLLTIHVDYDYPDELVETHVYFYDMAGRMTHVISQEDAQLIQCNLSEIGLAPGLYTYRILMKTKNTSMVTKASKLIVTF